MTNPTEEDGDASPTDIFRPGPLEKLSNPEQLDTLLVVVTPKMWISIVCLLILLFCFVLWAIFGSIPITVHGRGIIMKQDERIMTVNTIVDGTIKTIYVKQGEKIKKDTSIADIIDYQRSKNSTNPQTELYKIKSPIDGNVLELLANEGETVQRGSHIISLESINNENTPFEVYSYFPIEQGKRININTTAYIAVSTVDTQEYGFLIGKVSKISKLAVSRDSIAKMIYNKELVDYLAPGDNAVIEVRIALEIDPNTNNYQWTSSKQPSNALSTGTVCTVQATVHRIRPIYYMLPLESLKYD